MEIKIGITQLNRELVLDVDSPAEEVEASIRETLSSTEDAVLTLTDSKRRTVLVPRQQIAYVELGAESGRQVGFGAL